MAQGFKSAGVNTREVDLTGPTSIEPIGVPAGVIGTAQKGPAFVPITLPTMNDFIVKFGAPTSNFRFGPLAANEWLKNSQALTYLRVLGVGDGSKRVSTGNNKGKVNYAGFVVGDEQPQSALTGALGTNTSAVSTGPLGRTYFLGAFMSQSANSTFFTDAGLSANGIATLRGVLMAASGVVLTLSSSFNTTSDAPSTTLPATAANIKGAITGSVDMASGKQEFVMLINGHKALDTAYPNVVTASFDVSAPNYFAKVFNKDPQKVESAGYVLYSQYDIHSSIATLTGSGVIPAASGSSVSGNNNRERIAFLLTGSQTRNSGSLYAPNYEGFEDRFATAKTPWFISQKFGGKPQNLFQVYSLSDGVEPNEKVKISIENIQPSTSDTNLFGTFDLIVRELTDNDNKKVVLEQWRALSLDPNSPRFIANMIGDTRVFYNFDAISGKQKLSVDGNYGTRSRYIRVKMSDDVMNGETPQSALPMGFRGVPHLITSGTAPMPGFTDSAGFSSSNPFYKLIQPPVPMRMNITRGVSPTQTTDKALYWGIQFERVESATELNSSNVPNESIKSFAKYFAGYHTEWQNVVTSSNEGVPDSAENGILDADRFNNNMFSLENIKVVYNSTSNLADATKADQWVYVRNGSISLDSLNLTRAMSVTDLSDPTTRTIAKFTVYLQGGFDGVRIFDADTYAMTNKAIVEEMNYLNRGYSSGPTVSAFNKALELMEDNTEVDIQLLTLPGIRHRFITDKALRMTEARFDAMLVFDIEERDTNNTLVTDTTQKVSVNYTSSDFASRGINSSFGAAYFPDVIMKDPFNNESAQVPPSVAVLGAIAQNDAIGFSWYAPAGFNRGTMPSVTSATLRLKKENMDALASANINPIVSFANSSGPIVWGQKTVQSRESSLDRVNVRRLLITLRREVRKIANRILFEQSREATLQNFSRLVNPIFKKVQDQQGIDTFRVDINTNTTTQADIENKTIRGKIYLVPTKTLEFLDIDFVLNNKASFISG